MPETGNTARSMFTIAIEELMREELLSWTIPIDFDKLTPAQYKIIYAYAQLKLGNYLASMGIV